MTEATSRYITIGDFVIGMLGFKSRISYYNHIGDEGWPQAVRIGNRPMLVRAECEAYCAGLEASQKRKTPLPKKRRRIGRPVKSPEART